MRLPIKMINVSQRTLEDATLSSTNILYHIIFMVV